MGSKLEMYLGILNMLAETGPLKITKIMSEANVSVPALNAYLDFLTKQGLIEEQPSGKRSPAYALTARGLTVVKFFKKQEVKIQVKEEDKISTSPY